MHGDSKYMEPSSFEIRGAETSKILVWLKGVLGLPVLPEDCVYYNIGRGNLDHLVRELCAAIKTMTPEQIESIIYNPRDKMARLCATWKEEHDEADRVREQKEAARKNREAAKLAALSKLTPAERLALGLK